MQNVHETHAYLARIAVIVLLMCDGSCKSRYDKYLSSMQQASTRSLAAPAFHRIPQSRPILMIITTFSIHRSSTATADAFLTSLFSCCAGASCCVSATAGTPPPSRPREVPPPAHGLRHHKPPLCCSTIQGEGECLCHRPCATQSPKQEAVCFVQHKIIVVWPPFAGDASSGHMSWA